jgi:DNA-binding beta-propeller fold protein YncE
VTPGKTRWTVFDAASARFFVNIGTPSQIAVFGAEGPKTPFPIPCPGAHGLDLDPDGRRLFCACDGGELVTLSAEDGRVLSREPISGPPDVVWFHPGLKRLYVAIADPGVVDVFDTVSMKKIGTVATEKGAKTTALDAAGNRLFVFLPGTHRAAVFLDS